MVETLREREEMTMHASGYALVASSLLLTPSPLHGEILRLRCDDARGILAVQYVIDTDRQRIDQNPVGGRLTHPIVMAITDREVRFVDRSGEARTEMTLDRPTGELASEIMEGPERGVSIYLTCRPTDSGPGQ